ncbi:MAG: cytochrome c [Saprospiraceae bacterium]|nr:cytochrome c [Saprospiraceae bacterium]
MALLLFLSACGGGNTPTTSTQQGTPPASMIEDTPSYDPNRGEGKFTAEMLNLTPQLDAAMAASGETVQAVKCAACHKLTEEKLVGPGWKGVTTRRNPEWIMNFITNPDPMIEKDPAVRAQLELCLVRMPNQNLSDTDARNILEFMRKNDGVK